MSRHQLLSIHCQGTFGSLVSISTYSNSLFPAESSGNSNSCHNSDAICWYDWDRHILEFVHHITPVIRGPPEPTCARKTRPDRKSGSWFHCTWLWSFGIFIHPAALTGKQSQRNPHRRNYSYPPRRQYRFVESQVLSVSHHAAKIYKSPVSTIPSKNGSFPELCRWHRRPSSRHTGRHCRPIQTNSDTPNPLGRNHTAEPGLLSYSDPVQERWHQHCRY